MAEADIGPFSWLRKILCAVAGNFTPEASSARPAPTIQSVFVDSPPLKINEAVYEIHRIPGTRPKLEIVFFHGLELGDCRDSYWRDWLSADQSCCWLKAWLAEDFPNARVLSVSFDSSLMRTSTSGRMDLYQIAENLERTLIYDAEVGQNDCPVVLVGHSLGGLVTKALCNRLNRSVEDHQLKFLMNLRGLFFYATPHNGTMLSQNLRMAHGELVEELKALDSHSARLNSEFGIFLSKYSSIILRGVGEGHVTNFGNFSDIIVSEGSARSDRYHAYGTVAADHFGVSKPESKTEFFSYRFLVQFIHLCQKVERGEYGQEGLLATKQKELAAMTDIPSKLQILVTDMGRDDFPALQAQAARSVCDLSSNRTVSMILDFPGILFALVTGLQNSGNQEYQKNSALALSLLASDDDRTRSKIVESPGVLLALVSGLANSRNQELREYIVAALGKMAFGDEQDDVPAKMINFPGLVQNLLTAMKEDDFPKLQAEAASVVSNLLSKRATWMMVNFFPGVLSALVVGLNSSNEKLQENCVTALGRMANYGTSETKDKMIDFPGLLQNLVIALETGGFTALQQLARFVAVALIDDKPRALWNCPRLIPALLRVGCRIEFLEATNDQEYEEYPELITAFLGARITSTISRNLLK